MYSTIISIKTYEEVKYEYSKNDFNYYRWYRL